MPEFRVPEECGTCDPGESLISYTYDEQSKTCVRTCQIHLGAAQVFTSGIPLVFLTLFAVVGVWFFNWINRNYGPRRIDSNARRSPPVIVSTPLASLPKDSIGT